MGKYSKSIIEGKKHFQTFAYEGNGAGQRVGRFLPFTDSGTIDNTPIGSSTPKSGSFTIGNFSGNITGNSATFSGDVDITGDFHTTNIAPSQQSSHTLTIGNSNQPNHESNYKIHNYHQFYQERTARFESSVTFKSSVTCTSENLPS